MRFINNRLVPRPVINGEACVACGVCVAMCPTVPKSVDWPGEEKTGPPVHNYKTCIRCYCCQELCPEAAISLRPPVIPEIDRAMINLLLPRKICIFLVYEKIG